MSLADLILKTDDLPREPAPTPEWPEADGKLFVRVLTGQERRDLELFFRPDENGQPKNGDPRAFTVGKGVVDQYGSRVFTDEHIATLAQKNSIVLDRLYDAIARISGIRADAAAIEGERKNSATTPGGDSSTD